MNRSASTQLQRRLLSLISSVLLVVGLTAFFSSPAQAANTGSISGKVTALSGGGNLEGITAILYTLNTDDPDDPYWDSDFEFSADTLADGTYSITSLPAGAYRVGFVDFAGNHLDGYYASGSTVDDVDSATTVNVTTTAKTGINAALQNAGHISGHVQNAGGDPLDQVSVDVYVLLTDDGDSYWESFWYGSTDEFGDYDIGGIPAGSTYRIGFSDDSHIGQFWNNKATVDVADDIAVTGGSTTSGKNAVLAEGGHVTGKVTGPGGVALEDADVTAYRFVNDGSDSYWEDFAYAYTDASGNYDLGGLPDGTVRIGYDYYDYDNDTSYVSEYWDNKATVEEAADMTITGANTISGKNAQLSQGAHIKGKVTKTGGAAAPGVEVTAYQKVIDGADTYWEDAQYAEADASGNYDLSGLVAGTYRVAFAEDSDSYIPQYWNNKATLETATDIPVANEATVTGKNAVLAVGGKITGKVTKSGTTTALADIEVDVYKLIGTNWEAVGYGNTASNGTYSVGGLRTGTYRVGFSDGEGTYASRFYDNDTTVDAAKNVAVTAPNTTPGINIGLLLGGKISGTVTLPAGSPEDGPEHQVEVYHAGTDQIAGYGYADSAAGNAYSVTGLAAGSYRVEFGRSSGETISAGQFYNNKADGTAGKAAANAVVLAAAGSTATGINATLAKGGDIQGKVVDGTGAPLVDCFISGFASDDSLAVRDAVTASNGLFDLEGLSTGDYKLMVDCDGETSRYYTGANGMMSTDKNAAVAIHTTLGGTTTLANDLVDADPTTITNVTAPKVTPTTVPRVGSTLTASRGTWVAPDTTVFTYQWLRDGVAITTGGTASTYTPVAADVGKKLSVTVTGTKDPLTPGTATSAETAAVLALPPVVSTTAKITVDALGKSKINVACTKACVGYLQVRTSEGATSDAETSAVVKYTVAAGKYASYALTSVPLNATTTAKVRLAQSSPNAGVVQFNALQIVRAAPTNTLKTTAKVTVSTAGKATVNVSCTAACEGYAQLRSDEAGTLTSANVVHYKLTKAGYTAMVFTGVPNIDSLTWKTRLAIVLPTPFPDAKVQFNPLQLVHS